MVEVRGLKKYYNSSKKGMFDKPMTIKAVDDVCFTIPEGKTLGMVGESGSGKTTTAMSIIRLIEPDSGIVNVFGIDVNELKGEKLRKFRKNMQMVFQDPYGSLHPSMTAGEIIAEPLRIHMSLNKKELNSRLVELMELTGLNPDQRAKYPHEFSGGQRQRIGIARAIALNPKFVILDEPVSSLDVSIQGQIINLLSDLQDKLKLTYLFVAHDLAVVEHISDRIAVMYLGRIVEENSGHGLYERPLHPYTQSLIASIPDYNRRKHGFRALWGEIPSPEKPPSGCAFHPRCPHVMEICKKEFPSVKPIGDARCSCFLYS